LSSQNFEPLSFWEFEISSETSFVTSTAGKPVENY